MGHGSGSKERGCNERTAGKGEGKESTAKAIKRGKGGITRSKIVKRETSAGKRGEKRNKEYRDRNDEERICRKRKDCTVENDVFRIGLREWMGYISRAYQIEEFKKVFVGER